MEKTVGPFSADDVGAHPQGISIRGKGYRVVPVKPGDPNTVVGCKVCAFYEPSDTSCAFAGPLSPTTWDKITLISGETCSTLNEGRAYYEEIPDSSGVFGRTGKEIHGITKALCR